MKKTRILLGVTGSIAAYKSADMVRAFQGEGFSVQAVMTYSATRFLTPLTLQCLTGMPVPVQVFDAPGMNPLAHIHLSDDTDIAVIAPATAHFIGLLAGGLAPDLLSTLLMAYPKPILVVPAMNTRMWKNPAVISNVKTLKKRGAFFLSPVEGKLACGTRGEGHIPDNSSILKSIKQILKKKLSMGRKSSSPPGRPLKK